MTQTLVQIRMEIVADIPIFLNHLKRRGVDDELLLKTTAVSRLVIGIGDIADGDALRAILSPDPIGIRQVDADGGGGVFVASEHGRADDAGRDALHHGFPETGIDRRVVLKPLCILTDGHGATGGILIDIFHQTLPRAFQSQGIAIDLDEAVDKINHAFMLLKPFNAILIENM